MSSSTTLAAVETPVASSICAFSLWIQYVSPQLSQCLSFALSFFLSAGNRLKSFIPIAASTTVALGRLARVYSPPSTPPHATTLVDLVAFIGIASPRRNPSLMVPFCEASASATAAASHASVPFFAVTDLGNWSCSSGWQQILSSYYVDG